MTKRGFTLLEILVVLALIGILVSFIAPNVLNRPDKARLVKLNNDFLAIETAMALYRIDHARAPTGLAELSPSDGPSYLAKDPIDPWGTAYRLHTDASGQPLIQSAGPDQNFDTLDIDGLWYALE